MLLINAHTFSRHFQQSPKGLFSAFDFAPLNQDVDHVEREWLSCAREVNLVVDAIVPKRQTQERVPVPLLLHQGKKDSC